MKKNDAVKETYRLWWEYLKQSEIYKKYCECIKGGRVTKEIIGFTPENEAGHKLAIVQDVPVIEMPEKLMNEFYARGLKEKCRINYNFFGNIHTDSFESWHKHNKLNVDKRAMTTHGVLKYSDYVEDDIEHTISFYKESLDREPTLQEFKDSLIRNFKDEKHYFYLVVYPRGKTVEELQKQLGRIIRERRKNPVMKSFDSSKKPFREPTATLSAREFEALRKYLNIYKLRNEGKLKWVEVFIKDLHKYLTREDSETYQAEERRGEGKRFEKDKFQEVRPQILRDYRKAKKIIKNVESGIFPGEYQK